MSSARYLVRFDDICPTMDWAVWEEIEPLLVSHGVSPLLAVVPHNQDPHLAVAAARADFWRRVRQWQQLGWTIAMHGFEHRYETADPGLVGINAFSEFAGLSREAQKRKLDGARDLFASHSVRIDAWIAPGHSFDATTVQLLDEMGVHVISDGFYWKAIKRMGLTWVPQQLWRFREMPGGLWTVCYHINGFGPQDIRQLAQDFERYRDRIVSLTDVLAQPATSEGPLDRAFHWGWGHLLRLRRAMK